MLSLAVIRLFRGPTKKNTVASGLMLNPAPFTSHLVFLVATAPVFYGGRFVPLFLLLRFPFVRGVALFFESLVATMMPPIPPLFLFGALFFLWLPPLDLVGVFTVPFHRSVTAMDNFLPPYMGSPSLPPKGVPTFPRSMARFGSFRPWAASLLDFSACPVPQTGPSLIFPPSLAVSPMCRVIGVKI